MPSLDAFDEEFGREEQDIATDPRPKTGFRLSTIIFLALAAGVISALALGWPNSSGAPRPESDISVFLQPGEKTDAAVLRLGREVEALKKENEDLVQERQEAAQTIAALKASEQGGTFVTWYSDVTALMWMPVHFDTTAAGPAAPPRRSATARSKPRETPRTDDSPPLSIEPQQIDPQ
jgi:FtsZ-binding cell division protein ZapB